MATAEDLKAPIFLLAMPQVSDPFFQRSVVLLLAHEDEGSFGFIVNRPTNLKVTEILSGLELHWDGDPEALAYFGGPVQTQVGTVLFGGQTGGNGEETGSEVLPGVRITQQVTELAKLAAAPPPHLRLYLGYAGWGTGQLVGEILRNDWLIAPVSFDLLFAGLAESVWEDAVRSVGVDPATLPAWSTRDGEEAAN